MAKRDQQGPTPPVFIDPKLGAEAAYRAGIQARRAAAGPAKYTTPVAGGPTPAIPRLDQQPYAGVTMAQQAEMSRQGELQKAASDRVFDQARSQQRQGIVERPQGAPVSPQSNMGILPGDTLPEQARSDPAFIEGHGSMFAAAQPNLASKYGVVRRGQLIPPQALRQGQASQLRPETLKDLETLRELQQHSKVGALLDNDAEAEKAVDDSAASAAGRAGNVVGDNSTSPVTDEDKERVSKTLASMDEFDFDTFRQMMMKDIINNPKQKGVIEAKLTPLSIDDLIMHNRAVQKVPIVPGFTPEFQSLTAEEDLALKRLVMQESKTVEVTDRYLLDKLAIMSIAVGLKNINGKPLGDHLDTEGNFDDTKFWVKFNRIMKLPLQMIASIGVNIFWFEQRVRKLFVAEKVGNG